MGRRRYLETKNAFSCPTFPTKVRYTSEMSATRALRRNVAYEPLLRCYACPDCEGFHLSKQPRPPSNRPAG